MSSTPNIRVLRSHKPTLGTPINIPATPLLQRLGYGTGVEVYRIQRNASKTAIKSPWAVKRITKRALCDTNSAGVYNQRLMNEAKILRTLNHPNIIGFRGLTKDETGRDVLALEICHSSLADIIEERAEEGCGPVTSKHALKVILDVCHGLDYLHNTAHILHGDLKAANVLVNGDFEICKICDFGVALPLNRKGSLDLKANPSACYIGTNLWAAPEVFEEEEITTKTDIYAFGCTVYEMLVLTAPHLLDANVDVEDQEGDELERKMLNFDEDSENNDSLNCSQQREEENEDEDSFQMRLESRMGSRPLLPDDLELGDDYDRVVEIYFVCTNGEPVKRPSAKQIIDELAQSTPVEVDKN